MLSAQCLDIVVESSHNLTRASSYKGALTSVKETKEGGQGLLSELKLFSNGVEVREDSREYPEVKITNNIL